VQHCAGVLRAHGVAKGDTVLIYMPMIPQTMISMLACARLGATHCVVFGGFAPKELSVRIAHVKVCLALPAGCLLHIDLQPKCILTATAGVEPNRVIPYKPMLDTAIELSGHQPKSVIVYHRHAIEVGVEQETDADEQW
jgi:propionyl-CoA synthetase